MNVPGTPHSGRSDSASGAWALTDDAMSAARAASRGLARGLSVAQVRRTWGSGGDGTHLWEAAQPRAWAAGPGELSPGRAAQALGPGRGVPTSAQVDDGTTLKQLLRWLSFRGGAVVECCPAALEEMYASAERTCKGPPGSSRSNNTLTVKGCGPDEDGSGCMCTFHCVGWGTPEEGSEWDVRPSVDCSLQDYLGLGLGLAGEGGAEPEVSDSACVEEPGDSDKCGLVAAQACEEFDSCSEPEGEPTGEASFYFIYASSTVDPCHPGDIALLTLLMDDAALLITQHVNLILYIVCRLFGPENARRVREFFSEPVYVEFRDSLPTVMSWQPAEEVILVDCGNTLGRTFYSTDSTECASAMVAAIVVHELIHRLPDRFEHSKDAEVLECEDSMRLVRWLRDELFRRLDCASS